METFHIQTSRWVSWLSFQRKTRMRKKTYINFACFVLFQHETQDLLTGAGTQAKEEGPLVLTQFPHAHWKKPEGKPTRQFLDSSVFNTTVHDCTLALPLGSLKQGKLGRVVHHRELVEQSLDHLSHLCLGADVQVLGRVLGEVERRPPAQPPAGMILLLRGAQALTRRERDGTNELEVNFNEARVDPVFILQKQKRGRVCEGSHPTSTHPSNPTCSSTESWTCKNIQMGSSSCFSL